MGAEKPETAPKQPVRKQAREPKKSPGQNRNSDRGTSMSTRSYICMEVGDDQYKTIYCHSDGYLSHNGALLLKYYSDREMVERLLERGDLSSLEKKIEPEPGHPHSFDWDKRQKDVCVFYGRDRVDKNTRRNRSLWKNWMTRKTGRSMCISSPGKDNGNISDMGNRRKGCGMFKRI